MLAPALTILLSSFLLFLVQPIIAKQILPWFGGSAGVWTICLVFFQLVLLLGYSYAHWLTRRRADSRQFALHMLLLLVSCLTLPIIAGPFWKPVHDNEPALRILGLLTATVGLPYFLLASTAPLLQRWLSEATSRTTEVPSIYRLFALSNLGSLVGLLSYPFAIEPFATVRMQAWVWSCAYLVFVACLFSYVFGRWRLPDVDHVQTISRAAPENAPARGVYAYWIGCAALGSILLLSVTHQVTENVAAIPFLWIVPLSLYLLSFIICFEGRFGRGWYERRFWILPAMLATPAMAWALSHQANLSLYVALPVYAVGLLLGCVVCHGELARSKPKPDYLTHFYLCLAAGGALGGLLVGLVAPQIFSRYWELPIALIALAALGARSSSVEMRLLPIMPRMGKSIIAALAVGMILLLLCLLPPRLQPYPQEWAGIVKGPVFWTGAALLLLPVLLLPSRAVAVTALLCTLIFDWSYYHSMSTGTQLAVRNFYGALRVHEASDGAWHVRSLVHGVIKHGTQIREPPLSGMPTTYYGASSGIGRAILIKQACKGSLRIGSIGLGAGTLAAYGRPGDSFRIYELNPAVIEIAKNQFTYLKDSKARIELVPGDARLSLERELAQGAFDRPDQRFDILSVDAFSGDAIPVHLLTREALASYARVITADGIIAFHISNLYLDLAPVVGQIARDAGFQAVLIADRTNVPKWMMPSEWVLLTRSATQFQQPEISAYSTTIVPRAGVPVWTDQFSNLLRILK
ncbi:MAG: fused MFS/spermidine synthase [Steroidobacteraceae bacterium]